MATDFRSGTAYPRRGRESVEGYLWVGRIVDKARAAAAGTIHDYIYPCPMDRGVLERWGLSVPQFDAAVAANPDDASMAAWLRAHVDAAHRDAANAWLADEKTASMDRQDREEGVAA